VSSATQMTDAVAAWQQAKIMGISSRTPRIKSFVLLPSRPFGYRAGQHVDIRLTAPDGYAAMRSYSIASAAGGSDEIELAVELLDDGEVSPFLHEVAEVGDEIELRGPLGGHFVWPDQDDGPMLLIGGGSGAVPLISMARHRQSAARRTPLLLLYSARTWDDLLCRDELIDLERQGTGFTVVFSLTRDNPRRLTDFDRRVDAAMMAAVISRLPGIPQITFVCGSNGFVNAAADGAIAAGMTASSIRTERYGV
jgi:ferredoxin-NADP reductase